MADIDVTINNNPSLPGDSEVPVPPGDQAAINAIGNGQSDGYLSVSASPPSKGDWMTTKWRPMMAITYMAINIFDFIVGPIFFNLLEFYKKGADGQITMWHPLTVEGGGLVHLAFGAILGVSAWSRHVEKQNGAP